MEKKIQKQGTNTEKKDFSDTVVSISRGVEAVKGSLDLTGKYPNTNKGRIGFFVQMPVLKKASPIVLL